MEQEGCRAEGRGPAGPAAAAGPLLRARARRPWTRRMCRPRGWRSGAAVAPSCIPPDGAASPSPLLPRQSRLVPPSPSPAAAPPLLLLGAAVPFPRQSNPAPAAMDWARAPASALCGGGRSSFGPAAAADLDAAGRSTLAGAPPPCLPPTGVSPPRRARPAKPAPRTLRVAAAAREMHSRREGMYFYTYSLLGGKLPRAFASAIGEGFCDA